MSIYAVMASGGFDSAACRGGVDDRSNWVDPTIKTGPTGMPRDPPVCLGPFSQASHGLYDLRGTITDPVASPIWSTPSNSSR